MTTPRAERMIIVKLPAGLLADPTLSDAAKLAYIALKDRAGKNGVAWPGLRTLAKDIGKAKNTAARAVRKLALRGFIIVECGSGLAGDRAGRSNRYRLPNVATPETLKAPNVAAGETLKGSNVASPGTLNVATAGTSESQRRKSGRSNVATVATEPYQGNLTQERKTTRARKNAGKRSDAIRWSIEGGWSGITDGDRREWSAAFPACDPDRELAAAGVWLKANPAKAVKRAWRRFVVNWLARSQERGGGNARPRAPVRLQEAITPPVLNA